MKKDSLKRLLVIAGAVLFNLIFWKEQVALNAVLFGLFLLLSVFRLYRPVFSRPLMKWLLLLHLAGIAALLIQNTLLSKIAFCSSLMLLIIFTQYAHRSVWYAAGSALNNFALSFHGFFKNISVPGFKQLKVGKRFSTTIRFLLLPLLVTVIFLVIYRTANAVFNKAIGDVLNNALVFLSQLFTWFSWERAGFLLLGLFISGGLLLKTNGYFSRKESAVTDQLLRRKQNFLAWKGSAFADFTHLFMGKLSIGMMALKHEQKMGLISLVLLNALLLLVNVTDIIYVWFGFSYDAGLNLKDYVHEGAGMLIFSILLAILLLLYFFRGNLNFYKHSKLLRYGAYAWIFQNAVLVFSVMLRDSYYIRHMGLAYKRIGLFAFLIMVLVGLISLLIKIKEKKTGYFLLRVNGWFAMVLLVAGSLVNWDAQIAEYNLAKRNSIPVDMSFLLSLSDKALPVIERHKDVLNMKIPVTYIYNYTSQVEYKTAAEILEQRKQTFFQQQRQYSWLSWNLADQQVKEALQKNRIAGL